MKRILLAGSLLLAPLAAFLGLPSPGHGQADGKAGRFTEHLVKGGYGYAYGIGAADIDGDGDLDLVSSDTTDDKPEKVNGTLHWFENDGKGKFKDHVIAAKEPGWFERLAIGDIDGDGKPDVAVVLNRAGGLVWFRNPSKTTADPWQRHTIAASGSLPGAYDVTLGDFDGDGKLDAIASSWVRGNRFVFYRNPGKDSFDKPWTSQVIDDKLGETRTVATADFNGDGRPDLLASAVTAPLIAWYENAAKPGAMPAWKKHVIDDKTKAPIHGHPVDMDGDGDLDVLMALGMRSGLASFYGVAWYENVGKPGTGKEWKKHDIGTLPGAFEVVAADFNGDGKLDVAATAWGGDGQVVWFANPGQDKAPWPMHVLKKPWLNANQVIVADLDGDRRPDIIASAERGANELRWWRNNFAPAR